MRSGLHVFHSNPIDDTPIERLTFNIIVYSLFLICKSTCNYNLTLVETHFNTLLAKRGI